MFEVKETKKDLKKQHLSKWISLLVNALEDSIKKPPEGIESIMEEIQKILKEPRFS